MGGIWIKNAISPAEAESDGIECRKQAVDVVASGFRPDPAWFVLDTTAASNAVYPALLKAYTSCLVARGYEWNRDRDRLPRGDRVFAYGAQVLH